MLRRLPIRRRSHQGVDAIEFREPAAAQIESHNLAFTAP
jgi:hypothetical protein